MSLHVNDVRYNAQNGAFEARVDIIADGAVFRYPCQVPGPLNMDFSRVRAGLERHAMRQSVQGAQLMSHL